MEPRANQSNREGPDGAWESRGHVRTLVLLGTTGGGIYLCYRLALPFASSLAWALALAVLFVPLQRRLEVRLKRPSLAALLSVLLIGLMVVVPVVFVGQRLVLQAAKGAEMVQVRVDSGEWRRALQAQPRLAAWVDQFDEAVDLPGSLKALGSWLSTAAGFIVKGSIYQLISFCLTFYLLFYLLRDRRAVLREIRALSPLTGVEMDRLFARVSDAIQATVYGTLAVAPLQGLLGGLMFWALGLSAPLLWGVVMGVLSVVPALGAFVVWIPAALFLGLEGSWGKALILSLWGMLVVGTIDNLLRPILVGNRLKLHAVPTFICVVGGLMLFGPAGLILGPMVLTLTLALLEIWPHRVGVDEVGRALSPEVARFENEGGSLGPGREGAGLPAGEVLPGHRDLP